MLARGWRRDRVAIVLVAVVSLAYAGAWRAVTRPMGDSASYRTDGLTILHGWHHVTDRTPGYPLLLWAAGSLHHETHLLFVAQLLLHAASVLLVVDVARRCGLPEPGRVVLAALLLVPPEMVLVVESGSEALTQFCLVSATAAFVHWVEHRQRGALLVLGTAIAGAALTRPSFALAVVPVAACVAVAAGRGHRLRPVVWATAPALAAIVLLLGINAVRFDYPGVTPLTGWYLSSRTSTYVEDLPSSEPARPILLRERDRELLLGDAVDAPNYAFAVRRQLERHLHLAPVAMDRRMLRLQVGLIARHPLEYRDAVIAASTGYVAVEAEPPVRGLGHVEGWVWALGHLVLQLSFVAVALSLPYAAARRRIPRRTLAMGGWCVALSLYAALVSVATETGTSRLRVPTDPLLVVLLVVGAWLVADRLRPTIRRRQRLDRPILT